MVGSTTSSFFGVFFSSVSVILMIIFYVVYFIGAWKAFVKAGHPGWAAIIPFYNLWIMVKIGQRPVWYFWVMLVCALLAFLIVPAIVLWVMYLILVLDIGRNYGQGTAFSIVLLWLLTPIGWMILGFGGAEYRPVAQLNARPA